MLLFNSHSLLHALQGRRGVQKNESINMSKYIKVDVSDLGMEYVLKAAQEGKLFVKAEDNEILPPEVEKMIRKACHYSFLCQGFLTKGKTKRHVKEYYESLFAEHKDKCMKAMGTESKWRKFVAQAVGDMQKKGLFEGKPVELAEALNFDVEIVEIQTVRRYISRGFENFF